jgi:cell division protein FtsW
MKNIDKGIAIITCILIGLGVLMVYSSSAFVALTDSDSSTFFLRKQLIPMGLGAVLLIVMIKTDYHFWGKCSYFMLAVAAAMLLAVLIFGPSVHGTRRWLRFGSLSLQPSEIAKLAVIIFIADSISREDPANLKHGLLPVLGSITVVFFLIAMEPSFGALSVLCITSLVILFLGGARLRHLGVITLGILGIGSALVTQFPYARARIAGLISREGYQLKQSIYGIGCGGIIGKGLGHGQEKLLFLPEAHTDFVFSIIGEELGFIGCCTVAFLFLILLMRGIKVGVRCQDRFGFLLACGISMVIFTSALFHMGVACGVLPTTGLPLPFLSFGGSSLLANMVGIGILLNISKSWVEET